MSVNRIRRRLVRPLVAVSALVIALLAAAPASAGPYRGIQTHSLWGATRSEDIPKEMQLSRDVGANMVRVDVGWSSLETNGKGDLASWYVQKLDRLVAEADARGIKVIVTLWGTPCWASSAPESLKQGCDGSWWDRGVVQYPPNNPADYGDIARWVTARYGTKLAALEIWNEANLAGDRFWTSSDEVGDYAALVRAAYGPAKEGNPNVPVIAGALAAADSPWLAQLYDRGIKGYYDGISVHPYNEWRDPSDMWQEQWKMYTLIPGTRWVRETQLAHGDSTPIWITEYGWSSCESGSRWCVSEEKQAAYTAESVGLLEAIPYLAAYTIYDLRNEGTDPTRMDDNFGLVYENYSPKPVYPALKAAWSGQAPPPDPGTGSTTTDGGTTESGTSSGGTRRRAPRVKKLRVKRGRHRVVVRGKAPAGSKVVVVQCPQRRCPEVRSARAIVRTVRVGATGRFKVKMRRIRPSRKPGVRAHVADVG